MSSSVIINGLAELFNDTKLLTAMLTIMLIGTEIVTGVGRRFALYLTTHIWLYFLLAAATAYINHYYVWWIMIYIIVQMLVRMMGVDQLIAVHIDG